MELRVRSKYALLFRRKRLYQFLFWSLLIFGLLWFLLFKFWIGRGENLGFSTATTTIYNGPITVGKREYPTIAFISYELFPVTKRGGGAGVVVNGLVQELLIKGHDIIMLADVDQRDLLEWQIHVHDRIIQSPKRVGTLTVYSLNSLISRWDKLKSSRSIFMQKSRQFALGLRKVYEHYQFDMIECFDYAGVAYEILREGGGYLPESVAVSVRFHGTLEMIDNAEGNSNSKFPPNEQGLMYLQEQFAINAADFLFCQAKIMVNKLIQHYNIDSKHVLLAPAPMNSILQYVDEAMDIVEIDTEETWDQKPRKILIYGRLQLVKGLEIILEAARLLIPAIPDEKIEFIFVGPDMWSSEHDKWTSNYLKSLVPEHLQPQIKFKTEPIGREELGIYSKQIYTAVFASQFEALNLAVHEVVRMHVPVVLSQIPTFVDYFENIPIVRFFETGNATSLYLALKWLLMTSEGRKIVENARNGQFKIEYGDAISVYNKYEIPIPRRRNSLESRTLSAQIAEYEDIMNNIQR